MKLGIIIVTYNSQKHIVRLLESIIIQHYKNFVVYIVDNNSKDETLNLVQKYHSKISICIIPSKINNGFAKGNNIGIQKAIDEGCELLFILNPDMQLQENCIDILTKRIMSDKKIGVIGPIVLDGNKPGEIIQSFGIKANFRTQKKSLLYSNENLTNEIPDEIDTDYVLGGAMMIKSSVLKIIGLFEEDYFMYNDELDISYRIQTQGFRALCIRDAEIRHFHDFSKKNKTGNNLMYYYIMRNRYLYFKKYHLYTNLFLSLILEFINFPLKIHWSIRRVGNIKILKFYYIGILDGLLGKKGEANKSFGKNLKAKDIILTIDYEIFLGKNTGTVQNCMIEPTKKLASVLENDGSKMTVFWDILHYYRLLELENNFKELRKDRILIEEQILDLARKGHDIQLHLHPHWLDAEYVDCKWKFNYDRFKLHSLWNENNPSDINTIIGCISISKKLIEGLISTVNSSYKTTTFRAGGYLIEPFSEIMNALLKNDIKIDCSVSPNLFYNNRIFSFDFRSYPNSTKYRFESSPKDIEANGSFLEIPITTIRIPSFYNAFFTLLRIIKYPQLENEREGSGVGEYYVSRRFVYIKKLISVFLPSLYQLTTDNNYRERFSYILKKAPNYSTMILHPKLLNTHTLRILDEYVKEKRIRFISVQDFLT